MNSLSLMLAGMAATATPLDETQSLKRTGQEAPPAVVPAGPDPVYPADFYKPFQPQTALDMLERTPGFILSEGTSVRGFGGAAGNVLIDGQRPTVKGGGISEVLRRIAASRVERVVLLRGTDAAEAQGQTLVANLVLRADAGGSGNASLTLSHTADGVISPSARISHARRIAGWQTNIELSGEMVRFPTDGTYLDRNAIGALTSTRQEHIAGKAPEYGLALSTSGPLAGGTLTVNLRLNKDGYSSRRGIDIFDGAADDTPDARRDIAYDEKGRSGELGLDWTRRIGAGWTAKLVGLGRIERYTTDEDYVEADYRGLSSQVERPSEFVARTTITREGNHTLRPEFGGEIAYNRLSSHLDYAEDTGSGLIAIPLANDRTRVSELRGEAFANLTVKLTGQINLETGLAVELSRIRVTGEAAQEQSLSYLKPSMALVWSPSGATQVRLGARRTVDQLSFGDFAASVNQADGRPLGGNSGLRPARVTRALLRIDHRWGKGGAVAIESYHQWHTGMLGYLVLANGDQAIGTIGNARQWGISMQGTLPLESVLKGARLTVDGTWRGSRFHDPIIGRYRPMDDVAAQSLTAEFRQDVPRLKSSWGVTWTAPEEARVFYTGEVLLARDRALWGAYIETTALAGFKATLRATAFNGQDNFRMRQFYSPDRAGTSSGSERRDQQSGAVVSLALARTF
ncbi:TonB-dependent receptor plug domain-containing protein [Novosphingobium guangzhouense]|uniref:Uncharacterized protein n=1 Tax=Novosphingobium guangzhouense TaxID=1850347 RepID=A0A2K2FTP7_9SPHN|nr:TonB-dependent receptor [Novosphingobium guangzhouense]PNU02165.1 hypothetical protein A8V01_09825 [Novosphingobium guangzhouense]